MSKSNKMFEELGYKKITRYAGDSYINKECRQSIYFKNTKTLRISTIWEGEYSFSELTIDEIKAIYQFCKERGWLDE